MMLTPRQIVAYLEFNDRLDRLERAHALRTTALGAQGDQKAVEKEIRDLSAV